MRRSIVVLAVALAGCGISKEQYAAKDAEAAKYQKALADESGKTKALEAKVAELTARTADLETLLKGAETDLRVARGELTAAQGELEKTQGQLQLSAAARQEAESKAAALAAKSEQYERLAYSLRGQIQAGQVEISELRGKMTVKLKDKILFASGSADLGKDGRVALDAVASVFKELKGKNVVVAGYTDDVPVGKQGAFRDNWDLSAARAAAVVRYLQGKGIDPKMLGVAGFSEYRPVVPNDSPANRSLNRRIEIALTASDYVPPTVDVRKD
jgi:chemotaxis protein MotB